MSDSDDSTSKNTKSKRSGGKPKSKARAVKQVVAVTNAAVNSDDDDDDEGVTDVDVSDIDDDDNEEKEEVNELQVKKKIKDLDDDHEDDTGDIPDELIADTGDPELPILEVEDEPDDEPSEQTEIVSLVYDKNMVRAFKKSGGQGVVYENIITGDDRVISDRMTMPVFTSIVGLRAKHISRGSMIFIDTKTFVRKSAHEYALEELKQGKCPFKIRLPRGNFKEEWEVTEFILPDGVFDR